MSSPETAPDGQGSATDVLVGPVPPSPPAAPADGTEAGPTLSRSSVSQSIAASLANRDRRRAAAGDPPPVSAVSRPAAAPAETDGANSTAPGLLSTPGFSASGVSALSPAPVTASAALAAPPAPAAPPPSAPAPSVGGPQNWTAPNLSSTPAWGRPESSPPAPAAAPPAPAPTPAEPTPPAEPAADKRDRRFRRFWEKSAPAAAEPEPLPPVAESPAPTATTALVPPAADFPAADLAERLPTLRETAVAPRPPAAPAGHLGAVPPTSAGLAVPVEAPVKPPPVPAPSPRNVTPTAIKPASAKSRQTRKARLRLARIDPWSIMKTTLLFGVAGAVMMVVAVYAVFLVIDQTGIYEAINKVMATLFASPSGVPFDIETYVNTERAVGVAAVLGAVNVVIITALATIFGALYNLAANIMGGIEVTLAED